MALGKIARPDQFKHLLWRRHPDPASWQGCRPEILATNGREVRRLSSQHQHIAFQSFEHPGSARDIVNKIESSVAHGVALLGYSMFSEHEAVAILHTGAGLDPGWVAFPHKRGSSSTIPTLPLAVATMPKLRLVGGAEASWAGGTLHLEAALEQRGESFKATDAAFDIISHITGWSVGATVGRDDKAREIHVAKKRSEPTIQRVSDSRLVGRFELDATLWREFSEDPTFRLWFIVEFDRELFCLPADWLRFWLQIEVGAAGGR